MKMVPYCAAVKASELTRIRVTTSSGLESIHVFIAESHVSSNPASRREQLLWQRRTVPLLRCTCAESNLTPADNATVALKY